MSSSIDTHTNTTIFGLSIGCSGIVSTIQRWVEIPMHMLRRCPLVFVSGVLVLSLSYISIQSYHSLTQGIVFSNSVLVQREEVCQDVLKDMMLGHWKTRPLTKEEDEAIMKFTTSIHSRYRFPPGLQRNDSRCGNVSYVNSNYRAICNPKGPTPCCYKNRCAMKSVKECVCKECFDARNQKHAEFSSWIPSDSKCKYKSHNVSEVCGIINDMTIMFIGDSLVRHLYTALLLVVNGNMRDGAIQVNTVKGIKDQCQGMYMFTEKLCRLHLNMDTQVCSGSVKIGMRYYYSSGFMPQIKKIALDMRKNSLLITGVGVHDSLNYKRVQNNTIPLLNAISKHNTSWPKLLWHSHHAPGIMKSPKYLTQSSANIKKYNLHMNNFFRKWNVPIFDTFNMTDGMMSFDGEHYGLGMNVAKANLLLSYIKELRKKENW